MPYLAAHFLDRCNERFVHWRLKGRLRPTEAGAARASIENLDASLEGGISDAGGTIEPVRRADGLWEASSPWSSATGRNRRWIAEVVAPRRRPSTGRPAPHALILLHGWLMDAPQLLVYRSWARRAAKHGIEVWMPRLPHHLERAEAGEVSGQRCLSPDVVTSLEAVRQAVAETCLAAAWLRTRGAERVGLWGMSLGGWVASLAATARADWDAVALWAPVASPVEVLAESRLAVRMRDAMRAGGVPESELAGPGVDAVTPARRRSGVGRDKVLLVGAAYDQVISPRSVARMARRWSVDVRWVPHGHISLMASRRPLRDTVGFLASALSDGGTAASRQDPPEPSARPRKPIDSSTV